MLRQVILFVPAIIIFPYIVGISAVWFVSPLIDGIVFIMLVYLILKEYKKMDTVNLSEAI